MSVHFTIEAVARITGGRIVHGNELTVVTEVATDTRAPLGEATLFVALRGANFDAHHFLDDAVARGAIAAVVDEAHADARGFGAVVAVEDTLGALQALAAAHRHQFAGTVVGITGSNGKTIVKEMLAAIAGRTRTTTRSPGSYNSQVGVAHSLFGIRAEHELAIIEAGISQPQEMERLATMIQPDVGIITNIGEAHLAGFGDLEVTASEKLKLFRDLHGPLIWNADDSVLRGRLANLKGLALFGFGEAYDAKYRIVKVTPEPAGFDLTIRFPDGTPHTFSLEVPGHHNAWNAAAAAAAADQLGVPVEEIRAGLKSFRVAPMRMEMHTTQSGVTLLNDAYSSDPVSAAAAVHALVHYAAGARTIAILGDMLDLGAASEEAHEELGRLVARHRIDRLVCVGPLARIAGRAAVESGMSAERVFEASDHEPLDELLDELVQPGDYVLFKGSRAIGLERAAQTLLESVAPTKLYVDLSAVRENVQAIRRALGPTTQLMAVVKSFGYGNDSNRVALTLVNAGVAAFMVAFPDEGIPLRRRGIDLPILVTNVRPTEADKIVKYGLTPLLFEPRALEAIEREAERRGVVVPVHVEVDTGMNRLGVEPADTLGFCRRIHASPHLEFDGIMTHFAAADDAQEDDFTRAQIAKFEAVIADLTREDVIPRIVHAANTAAAWRFPEARYDMVRVGLGLYGIHPSADVAHDVKGTTPALEFVTEITHVQDVAAGESVGYGRTWRPDAPRRIATIAAGYNDGFSRFMSNGGEVLIHGHRCPVVGSVCMDVSMVDVTDVPAAAPGDEVVIFGTRDGVELSIDEMAKRGHTISYEILTNISPRVRRIFRR